MGTPTVKVIGYIRTQNTALLYDTRTAGEFTRAIVTSLQGPPLATVLYDVASAMAGYGQVPSNTERGVFAAAYTSLASAVVRTQPTLGSARIDVQSFARSIDFPSLYSLVTRYYDTKDFLPTDLSRYLSHRLHSTP